MITRFSHLLVLSGFILSLHFTSGKVLKDVQQSANRLLSRKRGLIEFFVMVKCEASRNPFDFNNYGCWCGLGGKGKPLDEVDSCCRDHDNCYKSLRLSGACGVIDQHLPLTIYARPYSFKECTVCEPASHYKQDGECLYGLCKCDADAAKCFAKYEDKYNQKFKFYPKIIC